MLEYINFYKTKWFVLSIIVFLLHLNYVICWEYAVSTKGSIVFYDLNWKELRREAHKFNDISAMAYSEIDDTIYFNDLSHPEVSIFGMKLTENDSTVFESLVRKDPDQRERIMGMVYDFYEESLFYTEYEKEVIVKVKLPGTTKQTIYSSPGEPRAITIDVCRRNLYYSNTQSRTPRIEKISLNSSNIESEVLVGSEHQYSAGAMTLDYLNSKIYWGDDRQGSVFTIDSVDITGKNYHQHLKDLGSEPQSIVTDETYVYYADGVSKSIKRILKNPQSSKNPIVTVASLTTIPKHIIARNNYLLQSKSLESVCPQVIKKLKEELAAKEAILKDTTKRQTKFCLNQGKSDQKTGQCKCPERFVGEHCETNLCTNYCLNDANCVYDTTTKNVSCACGIGFKGTRCETKICPDTYCLNHGHCRPDNFGNPKCSCPDGEFIGDRCEKNIYYVCLKYCQEGVGGDTMDMDQICGNCTHHRNIQPFFLNDHLPCTDRNNRNITYMVLAGCGTASLVTFLLILVFVRKTNKPIRPKIKKKYVVHKNMETASCRPTTEQCEIIIEDCCNMNICDTPCFDPKTLQQELSEANLNVTLTSSKRCKTDDKRELLKNMEGDLY